MLKPGGHGTLHLISIHHLPHVRPHVRRGVLEPREQRGRSTGCTTTASTRSSCCSSHALGVTDLDIKYHRTSFWVHFSKGTERTFHSDDVEQAVLPEPGAARGDPAPSPARAGLTRTSPLMGASAADRGRVLVTGCEPRHRPRARAAVRARRLRRDRDVPRPRRRRATCTRWRAHDPHGSTVLHARRDLGDRPRRGRRSRARRRTDRHPRRQRRGVRRHAVALRRRRLGGVAHARSRSTCSAASASRTRLWPQRRREHGAQDRVRVEPGRPPARGDAEPLVHLHVEQGRAQLRGALPRARPRDRRRDRRAR